MKVLFAQVDGGTRNLGWIKANWVAHFSAIINESIYALWIRKEKYVCGGVYGIPFMN